MGRLDGSVHVTLLLAIPPTHPPPTRARDRERGRQRGAKQRGTKQRDAKQRGGSPTTLVVGGRDLASTILDPRRALALACVRSGARARARAHALRTALRRRVRSAGEARIDPARTTRRTRRGELAVREQGLAVHAIATLADLLVYVQDDPVARAHAGAVQAYRERYGVS